MAMRDGTRRWAIRGAWAALLVASAMLVGLRVGRPLWYTDGSQPIDARDLAAAGMVKWGAPEVACELPGPVVGRVAQLPDGRLLYGRRIEDGTTDLVTFDPARPQLSPEPAYGLNTAQNDLAPALGPDGRLYFASDREGGVGGYDLYVASFGPEGFGTPAPLVLCNTARDETDPAPHPDGSTFVFVRIDPQVDEGRGGAMFCCRLTDGVEPVPVFPLTVARRDAPTDRDPAFASNGGALWFVRKARGERLQLVRASQLGDTFDEPRAIGTEWGGLELRSPTPTADGLRLALVLPARPNAPGDYWYRSTATELYPWWPGQRWLEWILLGAILVSALLLVLLHLGRRWSSLDFVAQCLLLSLLLHVLLFLWLWRVEIVGALVIGEEASGAMEVSLRSEASDGSANATESEASGVGAGEVAARASFVMSERVLTSDAPTVTPERAALDPVAAAAAERDTNATARAMDPRTEVNDAAADAARRDGRDVAATVQAAEVERVLASTAGDATARAADRERTAPAPVATSRPDDVVERVAIDPTRVAGTAEPVAAPTTASEVEAATPALQDVANAATPAARSGTDAAATPLVATAHRVDPAAPMAANGSRDGVAPAAAPSPAAPVANVERVAADLPAVPVGTVADVATPSPRALDTSTTRTTLRESSAATAARREAAAAPVTGTPRTELAPVEPVRGAVVAAARSASEAGESPTGGIVVPDTRLAPSVAPAAPAAAAPPLAVADASPKAPTPRVVPRDTAAAAVERQNAPLRAAAAPGVANFEPARTTIGERATAAPAASRTPVPDAARAGVRVPESGIERSAGSLAAAARGDAPAPPTTTPRRAGVAVALREGGATSTVPAPLRPDAVRAENRGGVAAAAAATPQAPLAAAPPPAVARTQGNVDAAIEAAAPPRAALPRSSGSLAPTPTTPDSRPAPSAARNVPRRTALQDGSAPVAITKAPAPPSLAAAAPTIPVPSVIREPLATAWIEAPRRVPSPRPAAVERNKVVPPGSSLERGTTVPLGTSAPPIAGASAYSNRFGPAKAKAIETFGGTADTERAVANGLRYLASIQSAAGTWGDREQFDQKYGSVYVGKTALCVLAFLGAGHTPTSRTEYSENVARAIAHLLSLQDPDTGAFGPSSSYGHGITTYALAECYGITKNETLQRPIEEALTWILRNQGPRRDRRNRGGWGYFSPDLQPEDDYARVSVSAWMIMALESARLSGVELPNDVLPRAREFLELSFDQQNGWFRYNHKPSRLNSAWPTLPASTPAGAFCMMLLHAGTDDPKVRAAVDYTVQRRPEEYRRYGDDDFVLRGQGNVYFWYYGTLCCFLAGGDAWKSWNERLRVVLPAAQAKDGSFPPIDTYAREAGDNRQDRSYTTAMCVLSLEIYYRYFTPLLIGR